MYLNAPLQSPNVGSLDLSALVQAGMNTLRLIGLADLSAYVFFVYTGPPSPAALDVAKARITDELEWTGFMKKATQAVHSELPRSQQSTQKIRPDPPIQIKDESRQ